MEFILFRFRFVETKQKMTKTLTLDEKEARKLYPSASPEFKALLDQNFGKDFFSGKITDRIKTWEDVCAESGVDPDDEEYTEGEPDEIAYSKIKLITKVLNEGWKPNWNNINQCKWYPWFYMNNPGFRLYVSYYYIGGTYDGTGARLCFSSRELSDYAANTFLELYKQFMTNGD